jgi:hypothetical protein
MDRGLSAQAAATRQSQKRRRLKNAIRRRPEVENRAHELCVRYVNGIFFLRRAVGILP